MKSEHGSLADRVAYCLKMSGGRMPICILVADDAERDRARVLLKGRKGAAALSFQTLAERQAVADELREWMAQGGAP